MNLRTLIGLCAVVVLAGAALCIKIPSQRQEAAPVTNESQALSAHWQERIAAVGGVAAYQEFAVSVASQTPEGQHTGAHAFGGALFEVEGAKGLSVCDVNFNFGCFHEFLGRAIATMGLSSVLSLNQGCIDALGMGSLSCQHGIGHGIMAYLGYSEKALLEGLKQCKDLPHNDPIGGCYGGLFMEYNLETMLSTQAKLRVLTEDPQVPCDTVDKEYRAACYYWQPQWWNQITKQLPQGPAAFKRMGDWCMDAGANIRDCFEGIGNITPPEAEFKPDKAKTLCEAVSDNHLYQLYCKSVAANSLTLGGAGMKGDGISVCRGLTGKEFTYCAAYAKNEANLLDRASSSQL